MSNKTEQRRSAIAELLKERGSITSKELVQLFHVTSETIRKDLNYLNNIGGITKTHGGAISSTPYLNDLYRPIMELYSNEKKKIAAKAYELLPQENMIIYIDSDSTAAYFAVQLATHPGLTVVTPSLLVSNILQSYPQHQVFLTGGYINWERQTLNYSLAYQYLKEFRFGYSFFGSAGIRYHNGATTAAHSEVNYKSTVAKNSEVNVVLCDRSKFSTGGIAQFLSWEQVNYFITDSDATEKDLGILPETLSVILA